MRVVGRWDKEVASIMRLPALYTIHDPKDEKGVIGIEAGRILFVFSSEENAHRFMAGQCEEMVLRSRSPIQLFDHAKRTGYNFVRIDMQGKDEPRRELLHIRL